MTKITSASINEFIKTLCEFGPDKTSEILSLTENRVELKKKIIIHTVSRTFDISENELINGRTNGRRTDAIAICCLYMKEYLQMPHSELKNIFHKKTRASVTQLLKKIASLNNYIPAERELIRLSLEIKAKIEESLSKI